ncbi:MAG: GNAT family N-acetyltransferase [Chloroflexi bacterium]|jgi:ribosomal protein S18 acetylase RimI-like enzyme|nr:GNAT family N-acetyltransferase [Chloroflexota bacterium]
MGGEITIRPFFPADQERAQELILAGLSEHFPSFNPELNSDLNNILDNYTRPGCAFLVAESDGILVGTGALIVEAEQIGRIVRVSVGVSHRRQGIGRLITDHLLKLARYYGYRQVVVETNDDWFDAIRFYQQCGFVEYDHSDGEIHMMLRL